MTKIVGVRFKPVGKMYYFDPLDFEIHIGDHVIVETSRGIEFGEVIQGIKEIDEKNVTKPFKGVIRIATREDIERHKENRIKEKEAYDICNEKIEKHGLTMKLIEVEYAFDRSKILFYFTADGRVDFRELVKDLAAVFRTRIELRQIGVRDESKTLGSVGICGRNLCCSQFLDEFVPVSIKMAKEQGLSLNPSKISGVCGRLMCCLKYEQDVYEELIAESPKAGARVMTPDGAGTVMNVALLRGKVLERLGSDDDVKHKEFGVSEIEPYREGMEPSQASKKEEEPVLSESLEENAQETEPQQKKHDHGKRGQGRRRNRSGSKPKQDEETKPAEKNNGKKYYRGRMRNKPSQTPKET